MGQEESKRANEPDGQSTPIRKRLNSFQRRSNRLSSTSSVRIPQSPTWDTNTPVAISGSSPGVFEYDSSNPSHAQLNAINIPLFEDSAMAAIKLKQSNLVVSSSLPKFDAPEKPKRSDSLIKDNVADIFQSSNYSQAEPVYSRSHSDTAAPFSTHTQKSVESIYLSTEEMPFDPTGHQASGYDVEHQHKGSRGNLFEGPTQDDETPVPVKNPMFMNLYNPSFDLIDLSPVDDDKGQDVSFPSVEPSESYKDQFFGSSFQKRQRSFELLDQNEEYDFEKTLKAKKSEQSSFLMGQSFDRNQEAEALPIFGLYSSQRDNSYALSSPYSVRKTELSVQPLSHSYSVGSNASKDLIQFSSSKQLDIDDSPEQLCQNDDVLESNYSNSGMDPLLESSLDAASGLYDASNSTGCVYQREKHDLVLEELMMGKKNAASQDNLKNAGNINFAAKVANIDAIERKSNSSLNFFSPASSTDGIYVINSFERKENSQSRERSRDRRTEMMDMKYCGEDGQCLVPKTPEDILDDAPKMETNAPMLNEMSLMKQQQQKMNDSMIDQQKSEQREETPQLLRYQEPSNEADFDLMSEFEPPSLINLPTKALKNLDSEVKRKTGSLRLFEETEQECLTNLGDENEGLDAIEETSPNVKNFSEAGTSAWEQENMETNLDNDVKTNEFFQPPENIYATLIKPRNRKKSKSMNESSLEQPSMPFEVEEKETKSPNKEEKLSEEAKKQNCNTFVRKKSQSTKNDVISAQREISDEQKEQKFQDNLNSGTFVRRKSLLKTPTNFAKGTYSREIPIDNTESLSDKPSKTDLEDNREKNLNSGTFVRTPKKLSKTTISGSSATSENQDQNQENANSSGTFLRPAKNFAKISPESSSEPKESNNDPEKNSYSGTFVRPKKKVDKNLIDAPHKVAAEATKNGIAGKVPDKAIDETIECEKRILAFKTDQKLEEVEDKSHITADYHKVQNVDKAAAKMLMDLIEDKMNYLRLHLRLKAELRSSLVAFSEQSIEDVWALEKQFADLHRRYEGLKPHLESYKKSANDAKQQLSLLHQQIDEQSDLKNEMIQKADQAFRRGEEKTKKVQDHWSQKIAQLEAEIKLQTFKNNQLAEKVEQKEKENMQVAKLCDEMIAKLNENTEPSTPI